MTEWIRLTSSDSCGNCRRVLPKQTICLEIRISGVKGRRLRCAGCAREYYGQAPETVASDAGIAPQPALPLDAAPAPTQGFVRADKRAIRSSLASAIRDYRERQAGHD